MKVYVVLSDYTCTNGICHKGLFEKVCSSVEQAIDFIKEANPLIFPYEESFKDFCLNQGTNFVRELGYYNIYVDECNITYYIQEEEI